MTYYLNSYKPLCSSAQGLAAISQHGYPPFVDGSCRREPDFQAPFPSITALCRGAKFAPKLQPGDVIAYITVKGRYCRRMVAVLKVIEHLKDHPTASQSKYYNGAKLPGNCMVIGNPPLLFDHTNQPEEYRKLKMPDAAKIRKWDGRYSIRANHHPDFIVCETICMNLHTPPALTDATLISIFGRKPGTQNPPKISQAEINALLKIMGCPILNQS